VAGKSLRASSTVSARPDAIRQAGSAQREGGSFGETDTIKQGPSGNGAESEFIKQGAQSTYCPERIGVGFATGTCEEAQTIVAAYGFTDVKAQVCVGKVLRFTASRDGKPFAIQIVAANGELAKVRRLR
jgi:hypothetical protein